MHKCNKYDEVCETKTCSESHMLKKDLKCCAGLITLRKHFNTKHPHTVIQSETSPANKARKESLKNMAIRLKTIQDLSIVKLCSVKLQ